MRTIAIAFVCLFLCLPAQARILPLPPCEPSFSCAMQSVVSVLPQWPASARRPEEPEGSGIAVHDGSLIATADHVLGLAKKVRIRTADGQIDDAEIVLRDAQTDIALLRINGRLRPINNVILSRHRAAVGDKACAIGNAFGLDLSLTCGVVSAINVTGAGFNQIEDFTQTDAAVNPGMSGGALIGDHGVLLGMLSAIFTKKSDSNIGVNFAVSRQLLDRVVYDYLDNGRLNRAPSGILIRPSAGQGGEIVRVAKGSAEDKAGLRAGDILKAVDERRFTRPGIYRRALAFYSSGTPLRVTIQREGRALQVTIKFEKWEKP